MRFNHVSGNLLIDTNAHLFSSLLFWFCALQLQLLCLKPMRTKPPQGWADSHWEAPPEGFPKVPQGVERTGPEDNFGRPVDALDGRTTGGQSKAAKDTAAASTWAGTARYLLGVSREGRGGCEEAPRENGERETPRLQRGKINPSPQLFSKYQVGPKTKDFTICAKKACIPPTNGGI